MFFDRMAPIPRLLNPGDIPFGHGLSRLAGWNQTRRDWDRYLALAPEGCFLAEDEGRPAGTATTTSYGREIAWIGMVLVHPDFRRRGLGTALLRRAISHLREERGIVCVRLDATPDGRPLYEGLGFQAEWGLRRWVREADHKGTDDISHIDNISRISDPSGRGRDGSSDASSLADPRSLSLDRAVFGADRSALLASLAAGSFTAETLADGSFGLMREGERAVYLGPVTAASPESGLQLAERLVRRAPSDRTVFWDLPDPNAAGTALAERLGFRPVRVLTRMWLGDRPVPADPLRMFGIAEPGLG